VYALGALWFGRAAGAVAALVLLTRVPILSYGVRAYVDVPYLLLVLCAVLVEARRRAARRAPAGAPVLALLALAGLLRPEAWAFSGLYWVYLIVYERRGPIAAGAAARPDGDEAPPAPRSPARDRGADAARGRRAARLGDQRTWRSPAIRCGR